MNLPEFPTDEGTLDMIMIALDPGPEAMRTSLSDLLELMSEMGGSDPRAVESIERIGGLPGIAEDLIADDEGAYEVHIMRDPVYHEHDVIRALVKALREERSQVEDVLSIYPADHATKSRDYGRGFADAIRRVREALGADGV